MSSEDSTLKLKPKQLAALVILMVEAGEVTNHDFERAANFRLTGPDRTELEEKLGLVESHKVGQLLVFELTERGWRFCKQLHTADVNVGRSIPARSIFALLDGLSRSLDRLRVSHAEFFKQPDTAVAPMESARPAHRGDNATLIRGAYAELAAAPGDWVGLAELRERLSDLDRATMDDALRAMVGRDGVRIIPVANTKSLAPRDRAAALRIGDEDNHVLAIGPA